MTEATALLAALVLAFANGANDNPKGVATLYGTGELGYRAALWLATATTALGSVVSVVLAVGLAKAFSAKGLVPAEVLDPGFLAAVGLGAAGAVALATRLGFPVSTTHALVGATVGTGLLAAGSALDVSRLASVFVVPLLVSPLLAGGLAWLGTHALRRSRLGERAPVAGGSVAAGVEVELLRDRERRQRGVRRAHLVSGSLVGFARGLNDTPKILGIVVGAGAATPLVGSVAIAAAMALGGLLAARRVTERLAHRIAKMAAVEGLVGNLTACVLVLGASRFGVPVSTTHVATGGIVGLGLANGRLQLGPTGGVVLAWVVTLPIAAVFGALALFALRAL